MNHEGQEGVSEGYCLAKSDKAIPGGDGAKGSATDELTPSAERRSLSLAFEPQKEKSPWECNRYRIGH
jgi:hypothetical protein